MIRALFDLWGAWMKLRRAFGQALRKARTSKSLTQEDFGVVSSRTYLSSLERGMKSPTLDKIDQLARHIGVHPLVILTVCYSLRDGTTDAAVLKKVAAQLRPL